MSHRKENIIFFKKSDRLTTIFPLLWLLIIEEHIYTVHEQLNRI